MKRRSPKNTKRAKQRRDASSTRNKERTTEMRPEAVELAAFRERVRRRVARANVLLGGMVQSTRHEHKMSRAELARRAGIHVSTLRALEEGTRVRGAKLTTLRRCASALGKEFLLVFTRRDHGERVRQLIQREIDPTRDDQSFVF